jgi:hypothetical protein
MRAAQHEPLEIFDGVWVTFDPLDLPENYPDPEPYRYIWELTGAPEFNGSRTTYFPPPPNLSAIMRASAGVQFHHASSVEDAVAAARELYQRALSLT